jgi:hypothetical protein
VRRTVEGAAIAGLVCLAASAVLFIVARILPDDLGRGVLLTFIGLPVMAFAALVAGWIAAVRSGRIVGVIGVVVAILLAILVSAVLVSPVSGLNAGTAYLVFAGVAAISAAAGYLVCAAGLPERAET